MSDKVVFAFRDELANVGGTQSQATRNAEPVVFEWQPDATERRWIYLVLHHTGTDSGDVETIDASHRSRRDSLGNPWLGIGYHFLIGNGSGMEDGAVEATFRWRQQIHGAHAGSTVHNANGIGICLVGNFQEHPPTSRQLRAVTKLVAALTARYKIPARLVIGHDAVKPTECPGSLFPLHEVIRDSVSNDRFRSSRFQQPDASSDFSGS